MPREVQDHYFREAKREGYRSRAAYKLIEIDDRRNILSRGDRVLDCGAAPGSWIQVAAKRVGRKGIVVGIDLKPISGQFRDATVHLVQGDLREIEAAELLALAAQHQSPVAADAGPRFDVILSDMAPNTTGDRTIDHHQSARLAGLVFDRCGVLLQSGGHVVIKVLEGEAYPTLLARAKEMFDQVKGFKPKASRTISTEIYLVAKGYRGDGAEPVGDENDQVEIVLPKRKPSKGWGAGT